VPNGVRWSSLERASARKHTPSHRDRGDGSSCSTNLHCTHDAIHAKDQLAGLEQQACRFRSKHRPIFWITAKSRTNAVLTNTVFCKQIAERFVRADEAVSAFSAAKDFDHE
jgi:hypothetical protein